MSDVIVLEDSSDDERKPRAAHKRARVESTDRGVACPPTSRATYSELCANPRLRLLPSSSLSSSKLPARLMTDVLPPAQQRLSFAPPRKLPALQKLPHGVVLLRGHLSLSLQHELLAATDAISLVRPFEIPAVRRPTASSDPGGHAFSSLYTSYAGMVWDGGTSSYTYRPRVEASTGEVRETPPVPAVVLECARRAVIAALAQSPDAFEPLPFSEGLESFTLILNFYARGWSTLSAHSDTSEPCLKASPPRLWPVVSMSIGDAAVFSVFPESHIVDGVVVPGPALDIELASGDVILFGGLSRLIRHSVGKTLPSSIRPAGLMMVPGRLNLTLRGL